MEQELTNPTIPAMLYQASLSHPDNPALVHCEQGFKLTYRHFAAEVARVTRGLRALGLGPEDRVVIWGPNAPEWLLAQWAVSHLDAAWVPLEPDSDPERAAYVFKHCGAAGLVMAGELGPVLEEVPPEDRPPTVVCWGSGAVPGGLSWDEMLAGSRNVSPGAMAKLVGGVRRHHLAAVIYTSGTTGRPKGVMLTHEALVNKCFMATERLGLTAEDRLALFFPLSHMFGNTCIALAGMVRGATLVMPGAVFEPGQVLRAMAEEGCTALFGTPAMLDALLEHPDRPGLDLGSLRTGIIGGASCPRQLLERVAQELGAEQVAIGYGATEASSWVTLSHPEDSLELRGSTAGTRLRGVELMIADPATGQALPAGATGEICTKGWLMRGYLDEPELTAKAIDQQGWYHTGDLGSLDDKGYLRILGRLQETIQKQGRVIAPAEIEEVLHQLPQVAEAQVFGVPRPGAEGEEVAAWLRLKPGAELSPDQVLEHCRAHLEDPLVPDQVRLVDQFPRTPSGKVQKSKLKEMALAQGERA